MKDICIGGQDGDKRLLHEGELIPSGNIRTRGARFLNAVEKNYKYGKEEN